MKCLVWFSENWTDFSFFLPTCLPNSSAHASALLHCYKPVRKLRSDESIGCFVYQNYSSWPSLQSCRTRGLECSASISHLM